VVLFRSLSDFGKPPARCLLLRDSRLPAPSRYLLSGINLVLIHRRAGKRASRRCALAGNRHRWSYRYCPLTLGSESGTIGIEPPTSAFFPYSARVLVFLESHKVRVSADGLLAEDYATPTPHMWGNLPQALTRGADARGVRRFAAVVGSAVKC